mgnify:CR=1 FL=1
MAGGVAPLERSRGRHFYRQRCVERIQELQAAGTTIVFVSHNLYMVKNLCNQGLFLANGQQLDAV